MALKGPPEMLDSEECVALRLPKKDHLRMNRVGRMFDRMVVIVVTTGLGFMLLTVVAAVFLLGRTLLTTTTSDGIITQTMILDSNATDDKQLDSRTANIINKAKRLLASPISIGFLRHRQRTHYGENVPDVSN